MVLCDDALWIEKLSGGGDRNRFEKIAMLVQRSIGDC